MGLHVHAWVFFVYVLHMCILPPVVLLVTELRAEFVDNGGAGEDSKMAANIHAFRTTAGFTYVLIIQK